MLGLDMQTLMSQVLGGMEQIIRGMRLGCTCWILGDPNIQYYQREFLTSNALPSEAERRVPSSRGGDTQ